ncbi:MAG: 3-oxoacyl-(Acyl-carrier-protein) reductase [Promethearchaeota archaeon]|nr:MAG: 3-oxoacyl-(Acyl-carrier-protein) reductase [Candidatus Lokiarchaeota archaeon]
MFIKQLGLQKDVLLKKVAIITGAGRGIGKELARALAWLGAHVIIAELNSTGKEVEDIINREGGKASYIQTDISKESDVLNLETQIIDRFGTVHILVNNAIIYTAGSINDLPMEAWDNAYKVNIRGAVFAIKTFLPYMLQQDEGTIVNVTSAEGTPYMAPYFASKAALASIAESLAAELDNTNISVFTFGPGMVDTPGIQEATTLLAPKFGMSEEEFQTMGVNPGYEGLMPAEHCAAGWAYTIVHAKEYHGRIADPFGPLLKMGLITQKSSKGTASVDKISNEEKTVFIKDTKKELDVVKNILSSVKKETDELSLFARRWMSKTFSKRCGLTIESFIQTLKELEQNLNDPSSNFSWHLRCLKQLAAHFKQNIEDAKGWIKDPDELEIAIETLHYRENAVLLLIDKLEQLESLI